MKPVYRIEMKHIESNNPETVRIYNMVNEECHRFNIYLADFYETLDILNEKKAAGKSDDETESSIEFVKSRIEELSSAMKEMAETMSSIVDLKVAGEKIENSSV
jgi:hypothetical protein